MADMPDTSAEEQNWLDTAFTYHPPTEEQVVLYQRIRAAGKELATEIMVSCPGDEDRARALDAVREAVMWANASIATRGK